MFDDIIKSKEDIILDAVETEIQRYQKHYGRLPSDKALENIIWQVKNKGKGTHIENV
jgi:hypothetical protein